MLITSNSSEQRGAGMAVYASAREIVGPDQKDFFGFEKVHGRLLKRFENGIACREGVQNVLNFRFELGLILGGWYVAAGD